MEQHGNEVRPLDRYLHPVDAWALAFGSMVGWGVFAMPGSTFLPVAGPWGTLIALGIGMVIMLLIGGNCAYLMNRSSITGGLYAYTKEAFGRDHAFLCSWFMCLSYLTIVFLNGTALFYIVRILMSDAAQSGRFYTVAGNTIYLREVIVSVGVLAGVGLLFAVAKPMLQRLHTVLSLILFASILAVAVCCLPSAVRNGAFRDFGAMDIPGGYGIFSLVILAPWAFVGFEIISFDTAHFRFPARHSLRLIVLAILGTAFAYISMTLIGVAAVPEGFSSWQEYISALSSLEGVSSVPTFFAAGSVMGTAGLVVMAIAAVTAILTGIIGGYRAATRLLSTMAEDHILSDLFSHTTFNIVFIMVLSILISLLGRNTLNWFVDLTSLGAIIGFGYTSAAARKIAKADGNRLITVTGAIGTAVSILFVTVQLVPRLAAMETMSPESFLLLSLWCLLGFLFYWRTLKRSSLSGNNGISASGIVMFALLVYSALMWLGMRLYAGTTAEEIRSRLLSGGVVLLLIIFAGLTVMLYVQNAVRKKHESAEREKIHAVESSLAKSQFLFNMSHDIRTPMNAIIGYTGLALKEPASDTVHDYLTKIDSSSRHLLALINDILEMSRIESGKIELEYAPADLREIFGETRELFAEQMRQKGLDFQVRAGDLRHPWVWCDRKNLIRVLFNLISNAYKFTPAGGKVTALLMETSSGEEETGAYEIRVQDNGIGMSPEFAERLFNAFERERTSTVSGIEGTGLGMSITRGIVDLMNGTIEVMTAPGAGTEFIIRVKMRLASPEETQVSQAAQEAESSAGQVDFSQKRLLLVEDNAINMEIARMILEQAGFQLETAQNGQEAVDMVSAAGPGHFDAVLMDIQMPVMDGYTATRAIRALENPELARVPIIAMTANAFKEDEEASREAGMQAHVAKPIDVPALMKTLAEVLK